MERYAVLIQNLSGFLCELEPHFSEVLNDHAIEKVDLRREFINWMVRQLLEDVYCLFDHRHMPTDQLFAIMYSDLEGKLPFSLARCFKHHIEAPHIYPENNVVDAKMVGRNILSIRFVTYREKYNPQ